MPYYHGIRVQENPTSVPEPVRGTAGVQVIFGTAPINLAKDPYKATNRLIIAHTFEDAVKQLGDSENFADYTLCQSMDVCFRHFNVAPIILCNVLDPKVHKATVTETSFQVINKQATVTIEGLLLDKLTVKKEATALVKGTDYIATFNEKGYVVITLLDSGTATTATTLMVGGEKIDPSLVESTDIIGGYNAETGEESGLELIRQVYPRFGLVPGLLLAPGWSHIPSVGAVLAAKSTEINGVFQCENILDLDCTSNGATIYTDCEQAKTESGYINKHSIVLWPKVKIGTKQYFYSAVYAAMAAYTDASNDDVPNLSPSNKLLAIGSTILDDGTEIMLDQQQANVLNGQGIVTAININGWRAWGNNTACYPENTDVKDRWIACRRFFSWWANSFILTYSDKVDNPTNYTLIESIVDAENIRGNSFVSQGKCAGARIAFIANENPTTDILNGKIQFKQYLAPYTPAEDILNVIEFDPSMIEAAIGGE